MATVRFATYIQPYCNVETTRSYLLVLFISDRRVLNSFYETCYVWPDFTEVQRSGQKVRLSSSMLRELLYFRT